MEISLNSSHTRTQCGRASNSEADEQVNVVGHDHISADADAKISCAPTIRDQGFVYFEFREQPRTSVSIECDKVNRRIEALEDQRQSWRFIFEHSLHSRML